MAQWKGQEVWPKKPNDLQGVLFPIMQDFDHLGEDLSVFTTPYQHFC